MENGVNPLEKTYISIQNQEKEKSDFCYPIRIENKRYRIKIWSLIRPISDALYMKQFFLLASSDFNILIIKWNGEL